MATGEVIFQNGITFASGQEDLLKPELRALFDEDVVSNLYRPEIIEYMGYDVTRPLNPNERYGAEVGAFELDEVAEGASAPEMKVGKTNDKWFEVKQYFNKIKVTSLMKDWLESSVTLEGADSSVQSAFREFANNTKKLLKGAQKKKLFEATKIYTNGFDATGGLTPDGQFLFDDDHPYQFGSAASTFQNVLGGSYGTLNDALDATALQNALDILKKEIRLHNGDFVEWIDPIILMVSRPEGVNARSILNTQNQMAGEFSGDTSNNNAMVLNTFSFEGNSVAILENPALGASEKDGTTIGADTNRFTINMQPMLEAEALRNIVLDAGSIDIYEDKDTRTMFTSYMEKWTFDHFGAERYTVGSKGTA